MKIIKNPRLFIDMDGTLAEWRTLKLSIENVEDTNKIHEELNRILSTPGYFYSLQPNGNIVEAIRMLTQDINCGRAHFDIYILSCAINNRAIEEKNKWLDRYLPQIDKSHRIFIPDGKDKTKYIPSGIRDNDFLLDDYTKNLKNWITNRPEHTGIKFFNGKNSNYGTWTGNSLSISMDSIELHKQLLTTMTSITPRCYIAKLPPSNTELFDHENFDFTLEK